MAKARVLLGLVSCLLLCGTASLLRAAVPTVQEMLMHAPKQKGVVWSIPLPEEYSGCEVKLVHEKQPDRSSYVLLDAKKQPVCRFTGMKQKPPDVYSYFRNGVEVYRETDTNQNGRPDQFRWLNSGGMKWGQDLNEDGKIDNWKMISAEEVAREVYQACIDRDLQRLQTLFITEGEMRTLKLPTDLVERIRTTQKEAGKRLQKTLEKMPYLNDKAQFVRVEGAIPHCLPADNAGTEDDLLQFPSRSILYQGGDGKHDWLQSGEMIKVGPAWRLVDVPGVETSDSPMEQQVDPALQKLFEQLSQLDKNIPQVPTTPGAHPPTVTYNLERVRIVERLLPLIKKDAERDTWIKQIFDNLSTAAQYSDAKDKRAINLLARLKDQLLKESSNQSQAAYATFRLLWAEYTSAAEKGPEFQKKWLENLEKFVQTYPRADDTPDALFHLGMGYEFLAKEDDAKRWYHQLHVNFPEHVLAAKAKGCEDRLSLVGKELQLSGPTLQGGSTFDMTTVKGKAVVVYYWTSYCSNCVTDFPRLKQLQATYGAKGLELVLVSLDDQANDARRYLQSNPVPGTCLFQAAKDGGGVNSRLAIQYGIQSLPTIFLVGRDGKVLGRAVQMGELEEAVKKALQ
jgi:thiol-disulfide isomerase/thioredoxin